MTSRKGERKNTEFESKLNEFYLERVGKGDALMTAERRVRRIRWLHKHLDVFKPDMRKLYVYIEERQRNGIKKKTIRVEMMDLEHWFSFIGSAVKTPRLKREPSPDPFVPTPEQLQKILRFCDQHHNREVWFRNRLIIEIFSFTGVRVGELVKVNLEDAKDGFLYVRSEKGEKDRYVPLPQGLQEHIETYREKFRMQSDQRALLTTDKGRMPYEYIRSMIKKIGVRIGMPEIHAHSFRHFYGTYMYRTTNDLRLVQILLGHARIETTTIYEHLSTKEAAEKGIPAVERLFHGEDKIASWVRIPAGAVQNKWDHWDSNPDLRVSSGS